MLESKDLRFSYNRNTPLYFPDIRCKKGEHWLILGESGSGKTTLLHLLAGLRKADDGSIMIDGNDIIKMSEHTLDIFRGQNIGIVFQQPHFVKALNIAQNLELAQTLAGLNSDPTRIHDILHRLKIAHKSTDRPHRLSVGEQQRASIARALVNNPKLILADEPTSALDDFHCAEVINLLREQAAADDITLLIVTHDSRLKEVFEKTIHLKKELV